MTELTRLTALRFAAVLDARDWAGTRALLSEACEYDFRGGSLHGPKAIIAIYREIGEWVDESFDSVSYESRVELRPSGQALIHFRDLMDHGEHHLDFRCQQLLSVDQHGRVYRIEHIDIPGESEKAAAFNLACGVKRP